MTRGKTGIVAALTLVLMIVQVVSISGSLGTSWLGAPSSSVQPAVTQSPLNLNITLNGKGATFPAPLILKWASVYHSLNPNITIVYPGGGSGAGQAAALNKTTDFSASDAPLSTRQLNLYPGILHIPETIGSVTLSYNLPGIPVADLNLTGPVLANIFLGSITNWNDSAIRALNPGLVSTNSLPNHTILTAHRKDGSGTTFVFTSYLCEESVTWCSTVGNGTLVNWPNGVASTGNGGVATYVNSTQYSLGYVELQYAAGGGLTYAKLLNSAGNYILPSLQSTLFAVENYTATNTIPASGGDWSHVRMLNMGGTQTYPIASFTYLLVYKELNVYPTMDLKDKVQAQALVNFLNWAVTTGQTYSSGLNYVQLPPSVVAVDQSGINSIRYTEISTPVSRNVNLSIGPTGFNGTNPGPSITVVTGDIVNLSLNNLDSTTHQWYIDFNNDGVQDANETYITCTSTTAGLTTCPAFTPTILDSRSVPAAGTYTYRDNNNPSLTGPITVLPQQTAAVMTDPATDLNSVKLPTLDSSHVATVGSLLINMRSNFASGNVTVVAADKNTASVTYTHTYVLSNLQLGPTSGVTGLGLRFVLNVAVGPYALSSNILAQLQGTTATTSRSLTRELDMNVRGAVDITDVGTVLAAYGTTIGQTGYNPLADLNGSGVINITGLGPLFANYGYKVFYS